ncbi:MAG: ATP-binding protein [Bacteroidota bacterium]
MRYLIYFWWKFSRLGVRPNLDLTEVKKIRIINQMWLIITPIVLGILLQDVLENDLTGVISEVAVLLCISLIPLLHKLGYFKLARSWTFISLISLITLLNILYGTDMGGQSTYFAFVVMALVFFEGRTQIWALAAVFIFYLGTEIWLSQHVPMLADKIDRFTRPLVIVSSLICLTIITKLILRENTRFEKRTNRLLQQLANSNNELRSQQNVVADKNRQLSKVNKELEKFAYVASHDLKTPLRNVSGFLDLIEIELGPEAGEELRQYIGYAKSGAKQMHYLVEDILEYARLDQQNTSLRPVNLEEVLEKVVFNLQDLIQQKKATIKADPLPTIRANESQLLVIFQNLIENGLKYNDQSEPYVHITTQTNRKQFQLVFTDNGIGIPPEFQERIFEMFFRLHTATQYEGTGIGLAIIKKIVLAYGGQIELHSVENEGSTFTISLPAKPMLISD